MTNLFNRFVREEQGQDLIEYALLAGLISLASILAITAVGTAIKVRFTSDRRLRHGGFLGRQWPGGACPPGTSFDRHDVSNRRAGAPGVGSQTDQDDSSGLPCAQVPGIRAWCVKQHTRFQRINPY